MTARLLTLAATMALLASCGGADTPRTNHVADAEPVDLVVRTSDGYDLDFVELRGGVVLVALLGTYDTFSQASLESLGRLARHRDDVRIVAILAQQGAEHFLGPYAAAANAPYVFAVDRSGRLLAGETSLGRVDMVPTFVTLSAVGVPVARHEGFPTEAQLSAMVDEARASAPVRAVQPPPLMGRPR